MEGEEDDVEDQSVSKEHTWTAGFKWNILQTAHRPSGQEKVCLVKRYHQTMELRERK